MNKSIALIIGVVIVVGGVGAFVFARKKDSGTKVTNTQTIKTSNVKTGEDAVIAVDACDVLTKDVAIKILGDSPTKGDLSAGNASTNDISVTNCIYSVQIQPGALKANNTKGVSVLARSAKTSAGVKSNKYIFGDAKPQGVQDVSGIGDQAFFNPKFGQLNVRKGGNYYIVSNYSGAATSGTLESSTDLAKLLSFK